VKWEPLVQQVPQVLKVQLELQVTQVLLALMEPPALQVMQVPLDLKVK
jgi:hypothetical protein